MIFKETPLKGSYLIELNLFNDNRGWFARTYCKKEFEQINHTEEWVQLNHSFTEYKGTIRGMHYQIKPHAEIKLVRCIAGEVFDVIVDLRKDSPTFLKWFGTTLSAKNRSMIYIPKGFAHGFQTLTDNCELIYHHSEYYKPGVENGILYNDKIIEIDWPLPVYSVSERDIEHQELNSKFKGIAI